MNIISSLIYFYIFYSAKLYADGILQWIFIGISIYAWVNWDKCPKGKPLVTRNIRPIEFWRGMVICIVLSLVSGWFLKYFTNDSVPFPDGICFITSVWATYLTAYFIIENWLVWIFTNLFYIVIYMEKELYPTTILYIILCVLAFIGYQVWGKASIPVSN